MKKFGLMAIMLMVCFGTVGQESNAATKYLPIEYHTARFDQGNGKGTDYWYTIIPAKYKMHYAYAEDKIFGRENHTSNGGRHGATLAINSQFLGFPTIDGVKKNDGESVAGYDFWVTENKYSKTAYDVFNVHATSDPTDERAGITFKDVNLGFAYDGDHVPYKGDQPWVTGNEIYMALFAQIIKDGEERTSGTGYLNARHPRTWLAYDEDGNQFVATAAGRDAPLLDGTQRSQYGLDYKEMIQITRQYMSNIKTMYNCDGGGSCSFVWKGNKLSPHYDTNSAGVRYERRNYGTMYWKVEKRKVTARHFLKGSNKKVSDDVVQVLDEGDSYKTQAVEKNHYKLAETIGKTSGILEGNVTVDYYYEINHSLQRHPAKAVTCTEKGNVEYWKCSICKKCFLDETAGKEIDENDTKTGSAKGHSWGDGVITTAPTCHAKGVRTYTCAHDSTHKKTEDVDMLSHKPAEWIMENVVEPTHEESGSYDMVVKCELCGDELSRETKPISATDHQLGAVKKENIVAATCDKDGGFDWVIRCGDCDEILLSQHVKIDATDHNWGDEEITEEPTCRTAGIKTFTCKNDPSHKTTKSIAKLLHDPQMPVKENETEPTCEAEGSFDSVIYCKNCNEEMWRDTRTVKACGHKAGVPVIENKIDATCEEQGSYDLTSYCTDCQKEMARVSLHANAKGHTWEEWKRVDDDYHARECSNDPTHVEKEKHDWVLVFSSQASCDGPTMDEYECSICKGVRYITSYGGGGGSWLIHRVGNKVKIKGDTYRIMNSARTNTPGAVSIVKAKNAKNISVPKMITFYDGRKYAVKAVEKNAFASKKIRTVTLGANITTLKKYAFAKSKVTTIVVKTKKLKKKTVKGSLKSSKVKVIKIKVGSNKVNKKYVTKYKKIFTKKNAGKKVKVKK